MIWPCPKLYWDDDREDEIPEALSCFYMDDAWNGGNSIRVSISCPGSEETTAAYRTLWLPIQSLHLKDRMKHTPFSNWTCHRNRFGKSNGISSIILSSWATECKSLCFIHIHRSGHPCALSGLLRQLLPVVVVIDRPLPFLGTLSWK